MARSLQGRSRRIASVELPRHYRAAQREILNADASVVDLRRLSPYYYGIGTRLLAFEHQESHDVAISLLQAGFLSYFLATTYLHHLDKTKLSKNDCTGHS